MPPHPEPESFGPEEFSAATGVSRETLARLKIYASLLEDWNARHNLVSRASLASLWRRHFLDSAQLIAFIPAKASTLVDLGSGAGFPGLVLAELLRTRPGFRAVLYEATGKKCRFLEAVRERLGLAAEIRQARIEDTPPEAFDVITARACSPLPELLAYAQRFWGEETIGLFHKGQNVEVELTEIRKSWSIDVAKHRSRSDASGVILEIRGLARVAPKRSHGRL